MSGAPLPRSISTTTNQAGLRACNLWGIAFPSPEGQWLLMRHGVRCFERRLLTVAGAAQEWVFRPHLFPVSLTSLAGASAPETCPGRLACGSGSSWTGGIVAQTRRWISIAPSCMQLNIFN